MAEVKFPILKTKRVDLVQLTDSYIRELFEIFSDTRVTEYMDIYPMKSLEETELEWVQWPEKIFDEKKGIRWGILYEERIIGTCGFQNISYIEDKKIAEIGYDLKVDSWGSGIISEIIPVVLEYAFSELLLDEIHALIFPGNIRSKKMIINQGFTYYDTVKLQTPCKNKYYEEEMYIYRKEQ